MQTGHLLISNKMQSSTFTRPITLCNQVVILDGLTGTGKTMFSPLVSSFSRVQNARFEYMFEYLAISAQFEKLNSDASSTLLNLLADIKNYDGSISREVNFRLKDLSSIFKSSKAKKYLRQLLMSDGEEAEKRMAIEKPILFLVTHQIFSCMNPVIEAFGSRLKVIEMTRHPLYLLNHWASYIDMHGKSPRDFAVWIDYDGNSIPWFAAGWGDKYLQSSQIDKVIYSIDSLMKSVFENVENKELGDKIAFIPFEQFVLSPNSFILKIENLIGTSATKATYKVLRSQKVPRQFINAGPQKNIYKRYGLIKQSKDISHADDYNRLLLDAQKRSSPEAFEVLKKLCSDYQKHFGLWF